MGVRHLVYGWMGMWLSACAYMCVRINAWFINGELMDMGLACGFIRVCACVRVCASVCVCSDCMYECTCSQVSAPIVL